MPALCKPAVREMTLDDRGAVNDLESRCGLGGRRDPAYWNHLTAGSPAWQALASPPCMGWVLKDGDRIVGSLGNLLLRYARAGRTFSVASANGLAVDPNYRGHGLALLKAFSNQQGVDLLLVTSAGPRSSTPLFTKLFQFEPLPQPDYFRQLIWVLEPRRFAAEVVRPARLPARWAGRAFLPSLLAADRLLRGRHPRRAARGLGLSVLRPGQVGAEFDSLWDRVSRRGERFMQVRDARALRWRFDRPGTPSPPRVICCHRGRQLSGYAVLEFGRTRGGSSRATLTDLLAEDDDRAVVAALLRGCHDQARRDGAALLDVLGFPPDVRRVFLAARPYVRDLSGDAAGSFLYRTRVADLAEALRSGAGWYACPSDGDTDL